jgi:hypothetical protein
MINFYIQSGSVIQCVTEKEFLCQWRRTGTPIERIDNDYLLTLDQLKRWLPKT